MTIVDWIFAVLLVVTIIVMIILTVYIVKFLKATTLTMVSLKELTDAAKLEITPALKSITGILETVNKVSNATNSNFEIVKKVITTILGASFLAFQGVKGKNSGFWSGLISGFNIFRKKGDKKCQ